MPIPIQEARVTDELRRAFKFVGRIAPRLDETVSPVVVVSQLDLGAPPGLTRRCAVDGFLPAVVGELGGFRFEVPAGVLAVVTRVYVQATTAGTARVAWGSQLAGPFVLNVSTFMDGRLRGSNAFPPPNSPAGRLGEDTQVAAITGRLPLPVPAGPARNRFDVEWLVGGLPTFDFLEIQHNVANDAFSVALEWIEFVGVATTL